MGFITTTGTKKVIALKKRIRGVSGGTAASKTISCLLYLIDLAQSDKVPTVSSVVSESFPHLKRGAMRDWLGIMREHRYFKESRWNKTDCIYTYETGSQMEFFSADQPDKVRGPRRDRLFINEANNVPFDTFEQLEVRTREFVLLDWNPVSEFWFYTDVKDKRDDVDFIKLTYKDNEALDESIIKSIEQRKERSGWWRVFGLGELGEAEEKIYREWEVIDEVPHEARLECYGMDFGYTNDPTAIVAIYYYNGAYVFDEIAYQTGFLNKQIADIIKNQPQAFVVADSAEPKSIDEIKGYGVVIIPSEKGRDSVKNGIQLVQDQRVYVTKRSLNILKEYRNYFWMTDRNGKILNEPDKGFGHSMDAIRYGITALLRKSQRAQFSSRTPNLREFKVQKYPR